MTTISNFVQVELRTAISGSDDTIRFRDPVVPANKPPDPEGQTAYAVLIDSLGKPTKFEIVTYTRMTFSRLRNVQRGQDGTTAQSWPEGTVIAQDIPADLAEQIGIQAPEPFTDLLELLDRRGTVTNSGGTIVNAQGLIEEVPDNTPRFSYDANGEVHLLAEEARTNELLDSQEFDGANWSEVADGVIKTTTKQSPILNHTFYRLESSTTGDTAVLARQVVTKGGNTTVFAIARESELKLIMLRMTATNDVRATFDLRDGSTVDTSNATDTGSIPLSQGAYLVWVSGDLGASSSFNLGIWAKVSGDDSTGVESHVAGEGIEIAAAQMESGSAPTSYIPTTTAAATRTADDYLIDGTAFSDFWNAAEGTIVADYVAQDAGETNPIIASANDTSLNNRVQMYVPATGTKPSLFIGNSGTTQALIQGSAIAAGTRTKVAYGIAANDFLLWVNGTDSASDTSGSVPSAVTQLQIGDAVGSNTFRYTGKIYALNYYPKRPPNTEVEALSDQSTVLGDGKRKALKIGPDGNLAAKTIDWSEIAGVPTDTPVMILERNDNPRGAWPDEANLYYGEDGGGILGLHMVFPSGVIKTLATR